MKFLIALGSLVLSFSAFAHPYSCKANDIEVRLFLYGDNPRIELVRANQAQILIGACKGEHHGGPDEGGMDHVARCQFSVSVDSGYEVQISDFQTGKPTVFAAYWNKSSKEQFKILPCSNL